MPEVVSTFCQELVSNPFKGGNTVIAEVPKLPVLPVLQVMGSGGPTGQQACTKTILHVVQVGGRLSRDGVILSLYFHP